MHYLLAFGFHSEIYCFSLFFEMDSLPHSSECPCSLEMTSSCAVMGFAT
jgi:hypothetical protein